MPPDSVNDVAEHPAALAWRTVSGTGNQPDRIIPLKSKSKTSAYRLVGCGVDGKQTRLETAQVERTVYEELLPQLPLRALRFHGFLAEEDMAWLFLEDTGGIECSFDDAEQLALTSHWIGQLHRATMSMPRPPGLRRPLHMGSVRPSGVMR